jgi:hypothetical protein
MGTLVSASGLNGGAGVLILSQAKCDSAGIPSCASQGLSPIEVLV